MIIQAVCKFHFFWESIQFTNFDFDLLALLDDLDKELNNYIMRSKEWYGWHFPELSKIITDNIAYIKTVLTIGMRTNAVNSDLSEILPEEVEAQVKEIAEVSMGTEIAAEDLENIDSLCRNALELHQYRSQLFEYLKNRMMAIAPNLTVLVGELVGARLISHAGSLLNLAKHPASTVQILGAEKALFRALKTKHDTPKYGLIYHAQLISQSNAKIKGKMSRMLAAKSALAIRVDALGEESSNELGVNGRAVLEARLKSLEDGSIKRISGTGKQFAKTTKFEHKSKVVTYTGASDVVSANKRKTFGEEEKPKVEAEPVEAEETESPKKKKKNKKAKKEEEQEVVEQDESMVVADDAEETETPKKKKKKSKKVKAEEEEEEE